MEELARRREEAARVELEASERDLSEARRVLALPPWMRELVLQKRVLCVSLTPELERVLREERKRVAASPHPHPSLPLLTTAEAEEQEVDGEARNKEGNGEGPGGGLRKQALGLDGTGAGAAARETQSQQQEGERGPDSKNASDAEDAGHEKVRTWVHKFAGTGIKSGGLGLNPFTGSVGGLNPFKETEWGPSRRQTAESSQLLSLSSGLPAEGSWNSGFWNGSLGAGARGGALHLSTLSIKVGSGATGGGTRPYDELSTYGLVSSGSHTGNPFAVSTSHEDTAGGGVREKRMPAENIGGGGGEQKLVLHTSPGDRTSLTPACSTSTRSGIGAATLGLQLRSVTRDGRIQIRCAPPFVLTRRIP